MRRVLMRSKRILAVKTALFGLWCRAMLSAVLQAPIYLYRRSVAKQMRHSDSELGSSTSSTQSKSGSDESRWTFWKIYIDYGLQGSVWNIFYLDPVATLLVAIEIIANSLNTYAMTILTKMLMELVSAEINPPKEEVQGALLSLCLLLASVMFTSDFTRGIKRLFRTKTLFYKNRILRRIENTVVDHMGKMTPETLRDHSIDERYEALNRFAWVYDNITDTLIETAVQSARSITFCAYIVYKEPRLLPVLCVIYIIMWRYVIPRTTKKRGDGGEAFWQRAYYDIATTDAINTNPLYAQLFTVDSQKNDQSLDAESPDTKKMTEEEEKLSRDGQNVKPDITERYMETIRHYSMKHLEWSDSHNTIQTVHNIMSFVIIALMVYGGLYGTALIVLINRNSLFGVISTYSDMKRCEKNAERSMEKIVKILDAVDKQVISEQVDQHVDATSPSETRQRLAHINIEGLDIVIPAQKKLKTDGDDEKSDDAESDQPTFNYDRHIHLDSTAITIQPHRCLLLDGHTGCGKSVTINTLAGLYSGSMCKSMTVGLKNGSEIKSEFNQIIGSRCYVSQMLSEDYKYNGKISLPLFKLFPGAKDVTEVRTFLMDVFAIWPASIPNNLTDAPHPKLSGGEIQRYVVASQVWKALRIRPDIMILDEVDRALDKETAMKVISWIVSNVDCFFVIVSHLTEVKQMLFDQKRISQVWTYDDTSDKYQISIRTHLI